MLFKNKKKAFVNDGRLNSVAIITDGNGRWAKRRGMPRSAGHVEGAKRIQPALEKFRELGVHYVTFYAFSTENWKRPKEEVDTIMKLVYKYVDEVVIEKIKTDKNFSVKFIGDLSVLSDEVREKCLEAENMARDKEFVCNIALNYGGRDEIVHAANEAVKAGHTELTEEVLSRYMYTAASPDPDLVIRTGGDKRISNFLLWQSAYSEFVFLDTLWPDFGEKEIMYSVNEFLSRKRRFGGLDKEDKGQENK
ncbi:MAG: di-trans,poly-cis-decaprenylcistransferase [Clostridia bacterium]|nr:di-trans,poly-cis-decaprenylcistransferase [Clostridia bacterium]